MSSPTPRHRAHKIRNILIGASIVFALLTAIGLGWLYGTTHNVPEEQLAAHGPAYLAAAQWIDMLANLALGLGIGGAVVHIYADVMSKSNGSHLRRHDPTDPPD